MNGIQYRLNEFLSKQAGSSLLVDASAGLVLGALAGLEIFVKGVRPILPLVNGIVCSPGQLSRLDHLQKSDAGLLVRMDWNNTLRSTDFVIPAALTQRVQILTAQDAVDLGAVGMVNTFLLGYEEEIEAACLKSTVQLALAGKALGIPLVVEVQTTGDRVSLPGKAIELGASYALEGGADVIVLPYPGPKSLAMIGQFVSVPWLLKPTRLSQAERELQEALDQGAAGLWLDHALFEASNPSALLQSYRLMAKTNPERA